MLAEKIPCLTIPLAPYLPPGENSPKETKRIRPEDALNLRELVDTLEQSILSSFSIDGKTWSVVSVYSPYSPDVHVMVMETSSDRYVPGPERIPDAEGDDMMEICASVLDFIARRENNATIHFGYNWSPRAWGEVEEKGGFQSIPTKWHAMIWGWPLFPAEDENTEYAGWIENSKLTPGARRILGENDYVEPFCKLIKNRLENSFPEGTEFIQLLSLGESKIDERCLYVPFNLSVMQILKTPKFFSQVLKPTAVVLEQITRDLTEAMTTLNCRKMDEILLKTECGPLMNQDLTLLRSVPRLQSPKRVKKIFKESDYSEGLLRSLWEPVKNRCKKRGNPSDWWRKGFGYALVFSGPAKGSYGGLRIMPGVYAGPGGVVEAQGVVLRRPEDRKISIGDIKKRSRVLWEMAEELNDKHAANKP